MQSKLWVCLEIEISISFPSYLLQQQQEVFIKAPHRVIKVFEDMSAINYNWNVILLHTLTLHVPAFLSFFIIAMFTSFFYLLIKDWHSKAWLYYNRLKAYLAYTLTPAIPSSKHCISAFKNLWLLYIWSQRWLVFRTPSGFSLWWSYLITFWIHVNLSYLLFPQTWNSTTEFFPRKKKKFFWPWHHYFTWYLLFEVQGK